MKALIRCKRCGKKAQIGFVLDSGELINACEECICDIGRATTDAEKDKVIAGITNGK